jgi:decaprenylphospho-beta-D-ribofuranose 2-oxidase
MVAGARVRLSGWGRYPTSHCKLQRPEHAHQATFFPSALARGQGRSYGDAALNGHGSLILTERLNRFLKWSPTDGTLCVEAGATIGDVLRFSVARGFFLPVVPGTQFVSIGGAIAADIHGKNHHVHGSFCQHVQSMTLILADGRRLEVSKQKDPELFWASAGAMGLTGLIECATIQLMPVQSAAIRVRCKSTVNLESTVTALLDESRDEIYKVAWIDALTQGSEFGRGNVLWGSHASGEEASRVERPAAAWKIPFVPPFSPLNPMTIAAFNELRYRTTQWKQEESIQHYEPFFFPLDGAGGWNKLYGPKGFLQYQVTLPLQLEPVAYLLKLLQRNGHPPFLVVLKDFGQGHDAPLSFPHKAFTLALDLPCRPGLFELLDEIDLWVTKLGGRVYLAKDARLAPELLPTMYPRLDAWRRLKKRVDPQHLFRSDQSTRLGLTGDP